MRGLCACVWCVSCVRASLRVCACAHVCVRVVIVYVREQCCHMDCVLECVVCLVHVSNPIILNKLVDVISCLDRFCHTITYFVI